MKKTIILVLTCICLVSCGWRNNRETDVRNLNNIDFAERFEYDGHKYIMFHQFGSTNYTNRNGVVHDPDCPCHNNK